MESRRAVLFRLMASVFVLTFVAFFVRGTTTILFGASTANLVSAPIFLIAISCAVLGFALAVITKFQALATDHSSAR